MIIDIQELVEKWVVIVVVVVVECLLRLEFINIFVINVQQDFFSVQLLFGCGGDCYCWCDCIGVSELFRDSQDYRCRLGIVYLFVYVGNIFVNGEGWGKLFRGFIDRFIKKMCERERFFLGKMKVKF